MHRPLAPPAPPAARRPGLALLAIVFFSVSCRSADAPAAPPPRDKGQARTAPAPPARTSAAAPPLKLVLLDTTAKTVDVVLASGKKTTQLFRETAPGVKLLDARYSPVSRALALVTEYKEGPLEKSSVVLVELATGTRRTLHTVSFDPRQEVTWPYPQDLHLGELSPDGQTLVFRAAAHENCQEHRYTLATRTKKESDCWYDAQTTVTSPEGKHTIAYASYGAENEPTLVLDRIDAKKALCRGKRGLLRGEFANFFDGGCQPTGEHLGFVGGFDAYFIDEATVLIETVSNAASGFSLFSFSERRMTQLFANGATPWKDNHRIWGRYYLSRSKTLLAYGPEELVGYRLRPLARTITPLDLAPLKAQLARLQGKPRLSIEGDRDDLLVVRIEGYEKPARPGPETHVDGALLLTRLDLSSPRLVLRGAQYRFAGFAAAGR